MMHERGNFTSCCLEIHLLLCIPAIQYLLPSLPSPFPPPSKPPRPFFPSLSFFPFSLSLSFSSPSPAANVIWFLCLSGCVSLCLHVSSSESSHGTAHMFLQNTVLLSVSVCMCVCVGGWRRWKDMGWYGSFSNIYWGSICVGSVWESGRRVESVSMYVCEYINILYTLPQYLQVVAVLLLPWQQQSQWNPKLPELCVFRQDRKSVV